MFWNQKFSDAQFRSIAKVVTWRVAVSITNLVGGFLASGSWTVGLGVVGFALVTNSFLYWVHERGWNAIAWGKKAGDG